MAVSSHRDRGPSRTLVLDSEAVSALAEKRPAIAARMEAAFRGDHRVVIPSVVLAEVMTGATSDAAVWRVLKRIPVIDVDGRTAARGGALRKRAEAARRKKRDLTVDAIVSSVALAVAPAVVLTADVDDFELLLAGHDVLVSRV